MDDTIKDPNAPPLPPPERPKDPPVPERYKGREEVYLFSYHALRKMCELDDIRMSAQNRAIWIDGHVMGFEVGYKSRMADEAEERRVKIVLPGDL
jgi:hypothetical protein